jgi:hypothetical protein
MAVKPAVKSQFERFTKAPSGAVPRIIGASVGDYGTGRSFFWLTAPGPIVVFSLDRGLEGVVEQFQEQKPVYLADYEWAPTDDMFRQEDAIELRNRITEDFFEACHVARTVILDKENQLYELWRYAEFGGPSDRPSNYSALYQRYAKLLNHPKSLTINFGAITDQKEKWVTVPGKNGGPDKGQPSGEMKLAGYPNLTKVVNTELMHERVGGGLFRVTVGKTRGPNAAHVQDQSYGGDTQENNLTLPLLGQMLFPDSTEESWL